MDIKEMTKDELLANFEAIIKKLDDDRKANKEHDWLLYENAVDEAKEKLVWLKQGIL